MMFGLYIFHAYLFKHHFAQHSSFFRAFLHKISIDMLENRIFISIFKKNMNIYTRSHNLRTQRIGWTAGRSPRRADLRVLIERLVL